jgi:hypothetical protein
MANVSSLVALKATVSILKLIVMITINLSFRNEVSLVGTQVASSATLMSECYASSRFHYYLESCAHEWLVASMFSGIDSSYFTTFYLCLVSHSFVIYLLSTDR